MTTTRPLVHGAVVCSAWDAFEINQEWDTISEILREDFSLSDVQSDTNIYLSVADKSYIKELAVSYCGEYRRVEISSTTYALSEILDIAGEHIFSKEEAMFGWLIFIDKNMFANWGHECEYVFYIESDKQLRSNQTMPPVNLSMEEVS